MLEMMQEQLNAAGGVLGRPVKIVIEDDKSDAKEAVTAANRLIDQEKAVALIAATGLRVDLPSRRSRPRRACRRWPWRPPTTSPTRRPMEWIWRTPHKDAMAVAGP